jgi:hypothetical protein
MIQQLLILVVHSHLLPKAVVVALDQMDLAEHLLMVIMVCKVDQAAAVVVEAVAATVVEQII